MQEEHQVATMYNCLMEDFRKLLILSMAMKVSENHIWETKLLKISLISILTGFKADVTYEGEARVSYQQPSSYQTVNLHPFWIGDIWKCS